MKRDRLTASCKQTCLSSPTLALRRASKACFLSCRLAILSACSLPSWQPWTSRRHNAWKSLLHTVKFRCGLKLAVISLKTQSCGLCLYCITVSCFWGVCSQSALIRLSGSCRGSMWTKGLHKDRCFFSWQFPREKTGRKTSKLMVSQAFSDLSTDGSVNPYTVNSHHYSPGAPKPMDVIRCPLTSMWCNSGDFTIHALSHTLTWEREMKV